MTNIIRHFLSKFAVPNMRNLASQVRIIVTIGITVLFLPLITVSERTYFDLVLELTDWVAPTLLAILIKGYLMYDYISKLPKEREIIVSYLTNLLIFVLVNQVLLKSHDNFWIHFWQFNMAVFALMFYEANRRQSLQPALAEARLTALTARIRPHFLFNSLNAAISLIRLRPYDAETLLENLANLFRAQLRDGSQSSTLGQEIEWAQEYMAIEQIRMGPTRVQVMWHHNAPSDAETPHLLLQPLLENAVFHGIESTHRPGCITVMTELKNRWIYITIENPYVPQESELNIKPHKGNSMALRNLRERLALMYDNDATARTEQTDAVFRIHIRLPYHKKTSSLNGLFDD
ncbi:sensor histidine kinase [Neisseria canis]|uniref:Inner membrane protein ypdA n=1 Tax=Neisseria canis TaxID=493 RepID=A0A448DB81_9NEIS|nr:histidine kinase [Neisseria canis]OSI10778.1 sensor histidine kinase [Neisseria canis]VEF03275.1 Inner membrane protein ypdA [Neisseria canis]